MKFLIIGLGNVGAQYQHTRHNIGFDIVAALTYKYNAEFKQDKLAFKAEFRIKNKICLAILPTTYMNLSGRAFKYWLDKEKIEIQNTITVFDDLNLPLDKIRIKPSGSHGGHNGLKDIEAALGHNNYPKLRFGIGNDFPKGMQAEFVLSKWLKTEEQQVKNKINVSVEALEKIILEGIDVAMNHYNNLQIT